MYDLNEVLKFVTQQTSSTNVTESSDIDNDLLCYGDDFHELIDKYSKQFNIDMTSYLWYFHTGSEGFNLLGRSPYAKVKHIPVTPGMLLDFANKGKWDFQYPPHTIPKKRYDVLINIIIALLLIAFLIYWWLVR